MKEYDLSQYILRYKSLMLFPLTKEEVLRLGLSVAIFEEAIGIPYHSKKYSQTEIAEIADTVDMNNNYWFLNTLWVGVDARAKAIVGTLKLTGNKDACSVHYYINENKSVEVSKETFTGLFNYFLESNNYKNISLIKIEEELNESK